MGALRLKAINQALALALEEREVVGKAHPRPVEFADTGEAIIGFPSSIDFDLTFQRGADRAVIPIWIVAGLMDSDTTLDELERLLGDGLTSVKAALETGEYGGLDELLSAVTVSTGGVDQLLTEGGLRYAAARFDAEIVT